MKALVAEYNALARLALTRMLEQWGYEVTATKDTAEAWQALHAAQAPRLAVLDWVMPEMDGAKVCRRVRALPTSRPPYIVLLTRRGDKESVVEGLTAGADDYLSKPYDAEELRARLEVGRRLVSLHDELQAAQDALRVQATTDPLTGVLNRGAVLQALAEEAGRAQEHDAPLGLGVLDIDHFKGVNDRFGHAAGDEVLREVVRRALAALRGEDVFGRFGGEEFLVIVPGVDEAALGYALERVRRSVAAAPVPLGVTGLAVTVSLGGAVLGKESLDGFIARADDALYAAKEGGRDRVVLAGPNGRSQGPP